jgi:hypothetical protein
MYDKEFKAKLKAGQMILDDQVARDQKIADYKSASEIENQNLDKLDSGVDVVIKTGLLSDDHSE